MTDLLAIGGAVALRRLAAADLPQIGRFPFTVSIQEPLDDPSALGAAHAATGLWQAEAGAVAIVEAAGGRLIGTAQFYRSAPCIHGIELGYILHAPADRGRGIGSEAVRLFSHLLFERRPNFHRQQLIIEAWNVASWKLAERCGFVREGLMRSAGFDAEDPADCLLYARTRKDWRGQARRPASLGG